MFTFFSTVRCTSILVAIALSMLAACSSGSSEDALRARVDQLQAAGEAGEISNFMEVVADDFAGNGGEFDRLGLERLLRIVALRHRDIGVTRTGITEVEMHGELATVTMRILFTGGSGGMLPESGQLFLTTSSWRLVGGDWQLVGASWKPVGA